MVGFLFEANAVFDGRREEHDAVIFADDARFGDHFNIDVVEEEAIDKDGEFFEFDDVGDDELTEVFDLFVINMFFDVFDRCAGSFVGRDWISVVDVGVDENFGTETGGEIIWELGLEEVFVAKHEAVR